MCSDTLQALKTVLDVSGNAEDDKLLTFLDIAENEIIHWKYQNIVRGVPEQIDAEDRVTQIYAVVAGYNMVGLENQTSSAENGTHRTFHFSDMVDYIRSHVFPIVEVRP